MREDAREFVMHAFLIALLGVFLAAPALRGRRDLPASRVPEEAEPPRRPRRTPSAVSRRTREEEREVATHARRLDWLASRLEEAVAGADREAERRAFALLRAEGLRHEEKLRRIRG
jgi:hypothetical protein